MHVLFDLRQDGLDAPGHRRTGAIHQLLEGCPAFGYPPLELPHAFDVKHGSGWCVGVFEHACVSCGELLDRGFGVCGARRGQLHGRHAASLLAAKLVEELERLRASAEHRFDRRMRDDSGQVVGGGVANRRIACPLDVAFGHDIPQRDVVPQAEIALAVHRVGDGLVG